MLAISFALEGTSFLQALRQTLSDSIAEGGSLTEGEMTAALDAEAARLAQEGF